MLRPVWTLALALLVVLGHPGESMSREAPAQLTVFAAASLREVFSDLASTFERGHPGIRVRFNFAGSQELRTQLDNGAAADVFASADLKQMAAATAAGRVEAGQVFAANEPVIVVPKGNPAHIQSLADLPRAQRLVVGTPEVPIGAYTLQILEKARRRFGPDFRARVEARVVSRELNVKQVLTKVALGEADAGVVYRTDVRMPPAPVEVIAIPAELNVLATYPIARTAHPVRADLAHAFIDLVLGPEGQAALGKFGFRPPH